jgi:5-methylcytosine-specific restriction endonuclease McrA
MGSTKISSPEVRKYKKRCAAVYGLRCYFCLKPGEIDTLTLEHLVPMARGGSARALNNHALACFDCNNEKSGLTVEEYTKVKGLPKNYFERQGELKVGLYEIGPVTNTVDLARLAKLV